MFEWTEFLRLADTLACHAGDEAAERSAISRAYYAAFRRARDFLDAEGSPVSRGGSTHHEVWDRCLRRGDPTSKAIYQAGRRLHAWRKNADYDNSFPVAGVSFQARNAVGLAREILEDLADLA